MDSYNTGTEVRCVCQNHVIGSFAVQFLARVFSHASQLITHHSSLPPVIAIIGRPNVGKSRAKYSKTYGQVNPLRFLAGFTMFCLLPCLTACIGIHILNPAVEAAAKGDEAKLQQLLDRGRDGNQRDSFGTSPLIAAAI